jgi:hypothetical protein
VHYTGFNMEFLGGFLREAGFEKISRASEFGEFNDTSSLRVAGVLISLNVEAYK